MKKVWKLNKDVGKLNIVRYNIYTKRRKTTRNLRMTSTQQRAELQRQIWQIANDVRGSVDGWDFKQYVLGTLFYRFISENFSNYIEGGDDSVDYATLPDSVITSEIKDDAIDITKLNVELKTTVAKIDTLRSEIDKIVLEIEA